MYSPFGESIFRVLTRNTPGPWGSRFVIFEFLFLALNQMGKDMFLEAQNETCGEILCLLGYIAYGVH